MLYDFYQDLLTEKQKQYAGLYFEDDFSLAEIAQEYGISRQAVYDNLKRAEMIIEDYEKKLQLLAKYEKRMKILNEMERLITNNEQAYKELEGKITLLRRLE